jgi:hypothetical protein
MFQFLREFITFSHGLQQTREPLYKVSVIKTRMFIYIFILKLFLVAL